MSNISNNQLAQVNVNIDDAKEMIKLADALERLYDNKDFNAVITVGYFKEEAHRAVLMRADPAMSSDENQKQMNDIITSIGGLYGYLHKVFQMGGQSRAGLEAHEQTKEDILQEQGEDNL